MEMRAQMGMESEQKSKLRGDASVMRHDNSDAVVEKPKAPAPQLEVIAPPPKPAEAPTFESYGLATSLPPRDANVDAPASEAPAPAAGAPKKYIPPHLRKKLAT